MSDLYLFVSVQLPCWLSAELWARTDVVLTETKRPKRRFGRQDPMHSGSQTLAAPENTFPDSLSAWTANGFWINKDYIPECSVGISKDHADLTRRRK